jgi:hypothetical protein
VADPKIADFVLAFVSPRFSSIKATSAGLGIIDSAVG